jgi:hypothetical protein
MSIAENIFAPSIFYLSDKTYQKILSFGALTDGWHYGEGKQIGNETIAAAASLLSRALSKNLFAESDAFPGLNGEVRVSIYEDNDSHEFTIEQNLEVTYLHESNGSQVGEPILLDINRASLKAAEITPDLTWPSYAFYRQNITKLSGGDSSAWASNQVIRTMVSQLLTNNASLLGQRQPARTFTNSTPGLPEVERSSYDLTQQNYRLEVA